MLKLIKKNIVFIILSILILILLTFFLYRYNNVLEGATNQSDLRYTSYTPNTCCDPQNCVTQAKGFIFKFNPLMTGNKMTSFYLLPTGYNPLIKNKILDTNEVFNVDCSGNLYKFSDKKKIMDENYNPITFRKIRTGSFLNCLVPLSLNDFDNYLGTYGTLTNLTYDSGNTNKPFSFSMDSGTDFTFDISLDRPTIDKINSKFLDLANNNKSKYPNFLLGNLNFKYATNADVSNIKIVKNNNSNHAFDITISKKDKNTDTLTNVSEDILVILFVSCILNYGLYPLDGNPSNDNPSNIQLGFSDMNTNYDITLNGVPISKTQINYISGVLSCNTNKYFVIAKSQ
jgi:hypothetical protein